MIIVIVYWHKNRQIGRNSRLKVIENHFDVKLEITEKLELPTTSQAIRVSNFAGIFSYNHKKENEIGINLPVARLLVGRGSPDGV